MFRASSDFRHSFILFKSSFNISLSSFNTSTSRLVLRTVSSVNEAFLMMLAFSTNNFTIAALTDSNSDSLSITESSLAVILSNFSSSFKQEQHVVSEFSELAEPVLSRALFFVFPFCLLYWEAQGFRRTC